MEFHVLGYASLVLLDFSIVLLLELLDVFLDIPVGFPDLGHQLI